MVDLLQTLLDMRGGRVVSDVNKKFNEVLTAVLETGGKGDLTLKLKIAPNRMARGGAVLAVSCEHECKMKIPELELNPSIFYITQDGNFTQTDPEQGEFDLQEKEDNVRKQ